jgi:hypothetical protein
MPLVSQTFDQLLDFTRTSSATFVGSNGLIQTTPASVNLLLWTQQFDNAAWTKEATTATANVTTAPDGTSTADKIAATATTAFHNVRQSVTLTVASYTYSVYAKSSEYSKLILANATSGTWSATFDLATGATIATGGTAVLSSSIQSVGNGWYRCSVAFTGAAALTAHVAVGYPDTGATLNNFGASYTGDGTSGVFLWGAQLEAAATATTYTRNNGGVFPPRFDYDPVTLAPKGILIEEQRVNRTLQSEDFTVSPWAAALAGTSTRSNTDTALGFMRGLVTATSALGGIRQTYSGLTSGQVYALSFYVQSAATSLIVTLENGTTSFGSPHTVTLNPSTGTAGTPTGYTSVTSTPFGSGYVYTLITAAAGGTLIANFEWRLSTSGNSMLFGRPQFEAGAFPTSYIPTVASQVTRAADRCEIVAPNFASWYNQSEGTLVVEADSVVPKTTVLYAPVAINNGTSANQNRVFIYDGNWAGSTSTGGVVQSDLQATGSYVATVPAKIAYAYKTNDFAASINGAAALTDTLGTLPTATTMQLGGTGVNFPINGHIRSIRYYPTRLLNAQLQALTA